MKHILKAAALMASSSAATVAAGLVRGKTVALLLGPAGVGTLGLLQSIQLTGGLIAGVGLVNSGVRQVADACAAQDDTRLSDTHRVLACAGIFFALLGALITFILRNAIASAAVGGSDGSTKLGWIALGTFASAWAGSHAAWLNGTGNLQLLARAVSLGALLSIPSATILVWAYGNEGIAPSVCAAAWSLLIGYWWYSRKIHPPKGPALTWPRSKAVLTPLLKNGTTFMATTLLASAVQAGVRVALTQRLGLNSTGQFQAAWSVSVLYVGFIINAMSADYYPRLVAVHKDCAATNGMVTEQLRAGLLLSAPLMTAMMAFAPIIVSLLYSSSFTDTIKILRWQVVGDMFKVATFPLSFVLLARSARFSYLTIEAAWNAVYFGCIYIALPLMGVEATGVAFVCAHVLYAIAMFHLVRSETGYQMPRAVLLYMVALLTSLTALLALSQVDGPTWPSVIVFLVTVAYSFRALNRVRTVRRFRA